MPGCCRTVEHRTCPALRRTRSCHDTSPLRGPQRTLTMRGGFHITLGVYLVLATSLLTGSAVGERHIRRITAADLPATSNSSVAVRGSNNNVLKAIDSSPVTNCSTGDSNGSCGEAFPEEVKRKTKGKLSELSSDDSHHVVEPSSDETFQERIYSDILLRLTTAATDNVDQSSHFKNRTSLHTEPSSSKKTSRSPYRYHDLRTEAGGFNTSLTTPTVRLFDERFLQVSESIKQNLEDLEERHGSSTSTPSSGNIETTTISSNSRDVLPTAGDIALLNGTKVALEYTNHVAIQYNGTIDPPRSIREDIVVENGTHFEYTSSFIHTDYFGETTSSPDEETTADTKDNSHASKVVASDFNEASADNTVEEASLSENAVRKSNITVNSSEYLRNLSSLDSEEKNINKNTVSPGEIHSTTNSGSPSRSQQTPEGDSAANSNDEATTIDPKLNKRRYSTRKIQISGVPITSTEPYISSTRRSRVRPTVKQTSDITTSETVTTALPSVAASNRTRARMISASRFHSNDTNSVEELPTLTPVSNNSQTPRRKQTTRYSWRRPMNRTVTNSEIEGTEFPMVRIQISTVQPSTTESFYRKNLIPDKKPENEIISEKADFTTEATRYVRRRQNVTSTVMTPIKFEVEKEDGENITTDAIRANKTVLQKQKLEKSPPPGEISSNEVFIKNSTKPVRSRGSVRYAGMSSLTGDEMIDSLMIPPTAAAWALATLRGPTDENTRFVRRPSLNDSEAEMTTTEQPIGSTTDAIDTEETTFLPISASNSSSLDVTSVGSSEDLLSLGFVTTQRAFEELETTVRSYPQSGMGVQTQNSPIPMLPTTTPDSIQEHNTDSGRNGEILSEPPTTKSFMDFITTFTSGEDDVMGTVTTETTTIPPHLETTVSPAKESLDDSHISVTTYKPITETEMRNTTDSISLDSTTHNYLEERGLNTTTIEPEPVTEVILNIGQEGDDLDDSDMLDTTGPPTTTTQASGVILGDSETAEEGHGHQVDLEEQPGGAEGSNSGGNEDSDYVAEIDGPAAVEPKVVAPVNQSTSVTTQPVPTTEETSRIETTEPPLMPTTGSPDTTQEPEITTYSWSPTFGDVTSYLRVTIHSTWQQLCHQKENFKQALARLVAEEMDGNISSRNIVLANVGPSQCSNLVSSDDVEEFKLIDVNVYVLNEDGVFDRQLNDAFYILVASKNFPSPFEIKNVEMLHGALPTTSETSNAGVIAAITISCIGAICLLLLAVLLIVMRKRQKRFNYGQRCTPVSLDAYSLDSVSVYESVRRKGGIRASKRSYGNPGFDDPGAPSHPMNFAGLANFSSDRAALEEEFAIIPQVTPKSEELPEGAETKNRYSNVIPLPETRVPLSAIEGEPLSDYINANYVRGPKNEPKFYIACQAPLQSTVTDFWRMVWEQQSKVIIKLTDLVENGVEKCADYLPPSEVLDCHRLFGDYQITLKKREEREKYVISTLQLKNLETNLWREVTHLWYLSWPHQGVPEESSSIIAFLIEARTYMRANSGPNIIHCSPGTGRTGAVLACDICIREFEQTRMVDIPRCVYRLRRDRAGAVKTKDQYVFIYQVLNTYATKLTGGGGLDSI